MKRTILWALPIAALSLFGCEERPVGEGDVIDEQPIGQAQPQQQQEEITAVPVPVPVPVPVEEGQQQPQQDQQAMQQEPQQQDQQATGGGAQAGQAKEIENPIVGRYLGIEKNVMIVQDNWMRTHALQLTPDVRENLQDVKVGATVNVYHDMLPEKGREATKVEVTETAKGGAAQEGQQQKKQ